MTEKALFRVGGYYRNGFGVTCRIEDQHPGRARLSVSTRTGIALFAGEWNFANGMRFGDERELDLIPGECDEHGNPLEDKKEPVKSIGAILREKLAASAPSELDGPSVFECTFFECDYDEPKRAPLPDYRDKPADRWDGYTVTKHTEPQASSHFLCASPDLQDESLSRHQLATVKG